jgi:hypothetical protein
MYAVFRNVHLAVGLFSAVFLLVYALSAAQMAYPVYRPGARETRMDIEVPVDVDTSPRAFARWLMTAHDLRGDLTEVRPSATAPGLTITRPGTTHRVELDEASRIARVTTTVADATGMANRIHHVRGVAHDYWAINAWGWFVFVGSVGLLVVAGTGTVMWFSRHRERRVGIVVFGVGLVWGLTLLVLVRLA